MRYKLLSIENIITDLAVKDKLEVLKYISQLSVDRNISERKDCVFNELLKREEEFSTNLGNQIVLPHIKSKYIQHPAIIILMLNKSIHWDDEDIKLVLSILMPNDFETKEYINVISSLSRKLIDDEFRKKLIESTNKEDIFDLIELTLYRGR